MKTQLFLNSQRLLELVSSYKITNAIIAALDLGIFTHLDGNSLTAKELAIVLNTDERATEILLDFLTTFNLLEKSIGLYQDCPEAAKFLSRNSVDYIGAIIELERCLKDSIITEDRIVTCVKSGFKNRPDLMAIPDFTETYTTAMDQGGMFTAVLVARAAGLRRITNLLDLGGGPGTFALVFHRINPQLKITVYEVPEVAEVARHNISTAGTTEISVISGDFMVDDIGSGYDCILMSNILHFYQDGEILFLLEKARAALRQGGKLLVHDFFLNSEKTAPLLAVLFTMDWLTHGGVFNLSTTEVKTTLLQAGYIEVEDVELPQVPTGLIKAVNPGLV